MSEPKTFLLSPCHSCGFVVDELTELYDRDRRDPPTAGSLMICLACGALSVIDESPTSLYLRAPTPDEHRRALADWRVMRAMTARAIVARRHPEEP